MTVFHRFRFFAATNNIGVRSKMLTIFSCAGTCSFETRVVRFDQHLLGEWNEVLQCADEPLSVCVAELYKMRQGLTCLADDLFGLLNQCAVQLSPRFFRGCHLFLCVLSMLRASLAPSASIACPFFHHCANGLRDFARTLHGSFQHAHTVCQLGGCRWADECCSRPPSICAQFLPFVILCCTANSATRA